MFGPDTHFGVHFVCNQIVCSVTVNSLVGCFLSGSFVRKSKRLTLDFARREMKKLCLGFLNKLIRRTYFCFVCVCVCFRDRKISDASA